MAKNEQPNRGTQPGSQLDAGNVPAGATPTDDQAKRDEALARQDPNLAALAVTSGPAAPAVVNENLGSVNTSAEGQEQQLREDDKKAVSSEKVKVGDKYKVVNLLNGAPLRNPYTKVEYPFGEPVESELDGFLHGQYLAGRVRLEK